MTDTIIDERVASVLRAFVRGCGAMLPRLAESRRPGLGAEERSAWWVNRVGRLTSFAAAVPGLAGVLSDRLPLQDALGAAGQGLVVCAIAGEHGVDDVETRVRLLAAVLFRRDVDPNAGTAPPVERPAERRGPRSAAKWLWRQGKLLLAVSDELERRPHGRFYHRALGMLPVVGIAGDYFGERAALKRAARAAERWLHAHTTRPAIAPIN